MPKIKLPKALLASEHLLIRKRAKKAMFRIVKGGTITSIADLQEAMINEYLDGHFPKDTPTYQESYIADA